MNIRYPIVKPVLPSLDKYQQYVSGVFQRCWLTNNGPLVQELETRLAAYLGVEHLLLVANGTLALQVAYKALNVQGKVLTTPFSFAATASSLVWQGDTPIFIDIDGKTFNTCPASLEHALQQKHQQFSAYVGVHVFGNPCDVKAIEKLGEAHNLPVIYDAAHAFSINYPANRSLLTYGDAATLSLHATKVFHCVEGGAVIFKHKKHLERARKLINFGFDENSDIEHVGLNAKMSEVHAAMGLALLDDVPHIIQHRAACVAKYKQLLDNCCEFQQWASGASANGAYMPVVFDSEQQLLASMAYLTKEGVQTRRYFYPSLSQVSAYGMHGNTPVSNNLSQRILCLPMYYDLSFSDIEHICQLLKTSLRACG